MRVAPKMKNLRAQRQAQKSRNQRNEGCRSWVGLAGVQSPIIRHGSRGKSQDIIGMMLLINDGSGGQFERLEKVATPPE